MAITQKQLAERLGVHTATVSRALRDDQSIPGPMRERVKALAAELHYEPNYHARSLRSQETKLIAVLKRDLQVQEVQARWIRGLLVATRAAGYKLRIDALEDAEKVMREKSADGFIVFGDEILSGEGAVFADPSHGPTVFIDCSPAVFPTNSVTCDNGGVRASVAHLRGLGHERIAYYGAVAWSALSRDRCRAFREALIETGATPDDRLVVEHYHWSSEASHALAHAPALLECVRAGATAVVAASDLNAMGVLQILRLAGYRVPEDISVVGYDDTITAALCYPELTTVHQDTEGTALLAAGMLLGLIEQRGGQLPGLTVPTSLVVRQSTGPATLRPSGLR